MLFKVDLTFASFSKTLQCDCSNESFRAKHLINSKWIIIQEFYKTRLCILGIQIQPLKSSILIIFNSFPDVPNDVPVFDKVLQHWCFAGSARSCCFGFVALGVLKARMCFIRLTLKRILHFNEAFSHDLSHAWVVRDILC